MGDAVSIIDLSRVTSMWIGETEKNLGEIFEHASLRESILLFDEASTTRARRPCRGF